MKWQHSHLQLTREQRDAQRAAATEARKVGSIAQWRHACDRFAMDRGLTPQEFYGSGTQFNQWRK